MMTSTQTQFIKTLVDPVYPAVRRVVLARPEVHNAFNDTMIREIIETFTRLGQDPAVRVIVLQSEGKSFCAGADLNWMSKMVDYSYEENVIDALGLGNMLRAIHDCPKPVMARVLGAAFGGGIGIICACDFAVGLESTTYSLSEVKLGLIPAVISPFVLRKMPVHAVQRYFITAEKFTAAEALRHGVLADVAATEVELDAWINQRIESILANGPEAVAESKVLINKVLGFQWEEALNTTSAMIASRRISAEGQEGMKAFLEKRKANWIQ
ncbi:MAG: enoyl-CoA hydratase-related protein [Candidatus Melainabacteria bacterium]